MNTDTPPKITEYGPSFRSLLGPIGFTSDGSTWVAESDGVIRITPSGHFTQKRRPDDCWYGRCYGPAELVVRGNAVWSGGYTYAGTADGGIAFAHNPAVQQAPPPHVESLDTIFNYGRNLATSRDGARWTLQIASNRAARSFISTLTFEKNGVTRSGLAADFLATHRLERTLIASDDSLIATAGDSRPLLGTKRVTEIVRITPQGDVSEIAVLPNHGTGWAPAVSGWTMTPRGDIWLAEWGSNRIAHVSASGEVTEYRDGIPADMEPNDIAVDARGNVWFDDRLFARVARRAPDGTIRIFGNAITPLNMPGAVVATSDGAAWFFQTLSWHQRLTRVAPDGSIREFDFPQGNGSVCVTQNNSTWCTSTPRSLSLIPDGRNVDVIAAPPPTLSSPQTPPKWQRYTMTPEGRLMPNEGHCFVAQLNFVCAPWIREMPAAQSATYAVIGRDNAVWFSDQLNSRIGRLSSRGEVKYFTKGLTRWNSGAQYMTVGPDGAIWFTEIRDRIGRITPDGTITEYNGLVPFRSFAAGIATGCDGNLWFTLYHGNELVRMTLDRKITRFRKGIYPSRGNDYATPDSYLYAAPDGRLWFSEPQGGRIATARIRCNSG